MGALWASARALASSAGFWQVADDVIVAGVRTKFAGKAGTTLATHMAMNLAVPVVMGAAFAPRGEKLKGAVTNAAMGLLFMGMSPGRMILAQTALGLAPHTGDFVRAVASTNRNAMEARTMAAIPFSYSAQSMDVAQSNYQASRQRLNQNYSLIGNEAAFYSAKYLSR